MTPAEVIPLRVPRQLSPHQRRRPRPNSGEIELFDCFARWRIPVEYEPCFFPLEFDAAGQVRQGFQPDGRMRSTRRYPECFLEVAVAGYYQPDAADRWPERHRRMLTEKLLRIQKLYDYYGLRTLLIDGPLHAAIVGQSGGRQLFYDSLRAVFEPTWDPQRLAA